MSGDLESQPSRRTKNLNLNSDLRDLQRFLSADLTPGGLDAARKIAVKANADAVPIRKSLAKLAGEFRAMGVALTPAAAVE